MKQDCKVYQDQFTDALYSELKDAEKAVFDKHLGSCQSCQSDFDKMTATLKVMDKREHREPDAVFWENQLQGLEKRLSTESLSGNDRRGKIVKLPENRFWQWSYRVAAVAAILLVGIFLGRTYFSPIGPDVQYSHSEDMLMRQAAVEERTHQYLEKSKVLLIGLVNVDASDVPDQSFDFSRYQKASKNLVQEANYLKTALGDTRQQRLRKLVSDLEIILLQIANLGAENDISAIDLIKDGVDRRGILLKINLEELQQSEASASGFDEKQQL